MRPTQSECKKRILADVIPLFAQEGYDRVTMRQIAAKAKITAGSLYHHFQSKDDLYLAAMKQAFTDRTRTLTDTISADAPPQQCLQNLISMFCKELNRDKVFSKLIHREILDGNKKRLRMVVDEVFKDFFAALVLLCQKLAPAFDPFLLTVSILSLAAYHYQLTPIRKFIPGSKAEHDDPKIVARHIMTLLLEGIDSQENTARIKKFQGDLPR